MENHLFIIIDPVLLYSFVQPKDRLGSVVYHVCECRPLRVGMVVDLWDLHVIDRLDSTKSKLDLLLAVWLLLDCSLCLSTIWKEALQCRIIWSDHQSALTLLHFPGCHTIL